MVGRNRRSCVSWPVRIIYSYCMVSIAISSQCDYKCVKITVRNINREHCDQIVDFKIIMQEIKSFKTQILTLNSRDFLKSILLEVVGPENWLDITLVYFYCLLDHQKRLNVFYRLILIGIACVRYYEDTWNCRLGGELVRVYFLGEAVMLGIVTLLILMIIRHSARGTIMDTHARRYVQPFLMVK